MPDEWQARQVTPAILQVSSSKHNSVCVCVRERRKIELTACAKKVPIPIDGIRTCTSGIRTHRASDYTTRAGTPRISVCVCGGGGGGGVSTLYQRLPHITYKPHDHDLEMMTKAGTTHHQHINHDLTEVQLDTLTFWWERVLGMLALKVLFKCLRIRHLCLVRKRKYG